MAIDLFLKYNFALCKILQVFNRLLLNTSYYRRCQARAMKENLKLVDYSSRSNQVDNQTCNSGLK